MRALRTRPEPVPSAPRSSCSEAPRAGRFSAHPSVAPPARTRPRSASPPRTARRRSRRRRRPSRRAGLVEPLDGEAQRSGVGRRGYERVRSGGRQPDGGGRLSTLLARRRGGSAGDRARQQRDSTSVGEDEYGQVRRFTAKRYVRVAKGLARAELHDGPPADQSPTRTVRGRRTQWAGASASARARADDQLPVPVSRRDCHRSRQRNSRHGRRIDASQPDGTGTVTPSATIWLVLTFSLELRCPTTAPAATSPATAIPATAQNFRSPSDPASAVAAAAAAAGASGGAPSATGSGASGACSAAWRWLPR